MNRVQAGKIIYAERLRRNLSIYAAAKKSKLSIEQVQGIESGVKAYTFDSLLKITEALNLSISIK